MNSGNVPEAQGTGLRQFSGIFSVTDVSGNNLFTVSSGNIIFGNSTGVPLISFPGAIMSQFVFSSGPAANTSLLQPLSDQTLYSILGRTTAGPGIQARWDSATTNRFLSFGEYDNTGVFSRLFSFFDSAITVEDVPIRTYSGTTAVTGSGVAINLLNLPVGTAVYLTFITIPQVNDAGNYNCVAIVSTNGTDSKCTIISVAGLLTVATNGGTTIMATQSSGAPRSITYNFLRVG